MHLTVAVRPVLAATKAGDGDCSWLLCAQVYIDTFVFEAMFGCENAVADFPSFLVLELHAMIC